MNLLQSVLYDDEENLNDFDSFTCEVTLKDGIGFEDLVDCTLIEGENNYTFTIIGRDAYTPIGELVILDRT